MSDLDNLRISEIAIALGLSKRVAEIRAKAEAWPYRISSGTGRPRVYRIDDLPADVRSRIEGRAIVAQQQADTDRQIATVASTSLTARQRAVMEARAAILLEVDRRVLVEGLSPTSAVHSMVVDSRTGRLPGTLQALASIALMRSRAAQGLSERTILSWRRSKAEAGVAGLAPKLTDIGGKAFIPPKALPLSAVIADGEFMEWLQGLPRYVATPSRFNELISALLEMQRGRA